MADTIRNDVGVGVPLEARPYMSTYRDKRDNRLWRQEEFPGGDKWVLQSAGGGGDTLYSADGIIGAGRKVTITDSLTFDGQFVIDSNPTPIYETDFENGTLGDFTTSGDSVWTVDIGGGNGGGNAASSGDIGNSQESVLSLTKETTTDVSLVTFDYNLSTEDTYDGMRVFVDGIEVNTTLVSTVGYSSAEVVVKGIGSHIIDIKYTKDGGQAGGLDRLLIDNFKLTPVLTNLIVNSAVEINSLVNINGELTLASNLNVAGNTVTKQINATSLYSNFNSVEAGTFTLGAFSAFSEVLLTPGFALANNGLRTMFSVGGRALNDGLVEYNNGIQMGVSSNTTQTSDPTRPVSFMTMTDGNFGTRMMFAGHTKASGASGMQSRFQIGYPGSAPNQTEPAVLKVYGDISADEDIVVTNSANGPVLKDRVDGNSYRLVSTSGVLSLELVV